MFTNNVIERHSIRDDDNHSTDAKAIDQRVWNSSSAMQMMTNEQMIAEFLSITTKENLQISSNSSSIISIEKVFSYLRMWWKETLLSLKLRTKRIVIKLLQMKWTMCLRQQKTPHGQTNCEIFFVCLCKHQVFLRSDIYRSYLIASKNSQ